jgi:hypothetical protein
MKVRRNKNLFTDRVVSTKNTNESKALLIDYRQKETVFIKKCQYPFANGRIQ